MPDSIMTSNFVARGLRAPVVRWRQWADRRCAPCDSLQLTRHNVFILPTAAGVAYGGLLVLLLLTAINYQNSLIYLLTFLLGMLYFLSIVQTFRAVAGLRITLVRAGEGFVGNEAQMLLRLQAGKGVDYPGLSIMTKGLHHPLELGIRKGQLRDCPMPLRLDRRGPVSLPRVRIESRFPFGLLRAWTWFRPASLGLAWPRPLPAPPGTGPGGDGDGPATPRPQGGDDWLELRPYRRGDLLQRVQWKRFARSGEMVTADPKSFPADPLWIDYQQFAGYSQEQRLSFMAGQVERFHAVGRPYGLRLPGREIRPASGRRHRLQCLRTLAKHGVGKPSFASMNPNRQGLHDSRP